MSKMVNVRGEIDIERLPMNCEERKFNDWTIKVTKSHILHSKCSTPLKCSDSTEEPCLLCLYTRTLELPHLPEMLFANNKLRLIHDSGLCIDFNTLDALKRVVNGELPIKVACSQVWKESRNPSLLEEKFKPFDWTFSSDYQGTVSNSGIITVTDEKINREKLMEKEKILFYQDIVLYEDELHDNGISICRLKIRVMPSSFLVLLHFFLRVDNVLARSNETRYYHEFSTNYILREYTVREADASQLQFTAISHTDSSTIQNSIPEKSTVYEKITFPTDMDTNPSTSM